jgi:A/G-specific adenine glycosylase
MEELALALPGIGAYTAAAILSIAYGKKLAVLDGNVARVLARLHAIRGDLRNGSRWRQLQKTANSLLAPNAPGDWNQAMMELGATICTPRSPQCLVCPLAEFCQARKLGLTEVIPEKSNKRAQEEVTLATLVLVDPLGRTLLYSSAKSATKSGQARDVAILLSRMWHFPTIQVQSDPAGELRDFVKSSIFPAHKFTWKPLALRKVRHAVTFRKIALHPFRLDVVKLPSVRHAKVLPLTDLSAVPISNLTRKVARAALEPQKTAKKTARVGAPPLPF